MEEKIILVVKMYTGEYNKIQTIIFVSNKQNNKVKILAKIEKDKDELKFIVDKEAPNKDNKEDYEKLNKLIKENIWEEIPEVKINENILNKYDKIYNELYDNKDSFMDIIC